MKKYFSIILFSLISVSLFSQSHVDALRYSQHTIGGTARSVGMGGAFGALGGDFSSLSSNPAGLGIYRSSELTITPEYYLENTTTRYYGNEKEEGKHNLNLSNLGFVGNVSDLNGVLKAVNFGFGFNRIANFHKNTVINGDNPNTSLSNYMAADGNSHADLGTFGSNLFFQGDVLGDDGTEYFPNSDPDYGYFNEDDSFRSTEQRIVREEEGKINEWVFSAGFNFNNFFYFGTTVGVHSVSYSMVENFKEYRAEDRGFQYFDYQKNIETKGTGYTAKFGAIIRPISLIRIGLAYHLPVKYNLRDEYTTNLWSTYTNAVHYPIDEWDRELTLESKYSVYTPAKAIGSLAFVIGKFLILSGDIEYMNYSKMRMKATEFDVDGENENIDLIYADDLILKNCNLKLGSEFRLGKMYLRGGFGYYASPYAVEEENYDAFKLSYSGGLGFKDSQFFFDLAYQYVTYDEREYLYGVNIDGTDHYEVVNSDIKTHRVMATVGYRF